MLLELPEVPADRRTWRFDGDISRELEAMGIVLPFLWVAAFYPIHWAWLAPLFGLLWVVSRIVYLRGYMADPDKRLAGAMLGGLCNLALFLIAAVGVANVWLLPHAM